MLQRMERWDRWDPDAWHRPAPTAQALRRDVLVGLALAACTCASLVVSHSAGLEVGRGRPTVREEVLWALAVSLPLCLRRRYPVGVLVVDAIAFIGLQARFVPESIMSSICLFLALYTAGAWGRERRVVDAVRAVVVISMFCWLAYGLSAAAYADLRSSEPSPSAGGPLPEDTAQIIYVTFVNILYFGAAWVFGSQSWNQSRQQSEMAQLTDQLRAERDENARRAVIAERVRIARELHDVVAHHVSVMGVQAAAARRVLDRDPALARATLQTIENSGRSAVEEMHRLLEVLREGDPAIGGETSGPGPATTGDETSGPSPAATGDQGSAGSALPSGGSRSPAPGVEQLPDLVARTAGPGLQTEFTVVGAERPLPRSVSVSGYRIVQEALTNTVRHAGAARVDVRVRYLADGVEFEIVDDGRGRSVSTAGSGLGHVGMRERVGLHGGELEIGRRPGGGYRVRARMPAAP